MLRRFLSTVWLATAVLVVSPSGAQSDTDQKPAATPIPYKKSGQEGGDDVVMRSAVSLLLALGIGVGVLYGARRFLAPGVQSGTSSRRLRVVERSRLTPKASLAVVEFDGETLLIGLNESQLVVVSRRPQETGHRNHSSGGSA